MSLAKELNINQEEVSNIASQINFMMRIRKENNLREEYVTQLFDQWMSIAKRLKKGEQLLTQTENSIASFEERQKNKRYVGLVNLYRFLTSVLGFYDLFFSTVLSESHYQRLKEPIWEVLV